MCNYTHCALCCVENGEIVPCNENQNLPTNTGIVLIDLETNLGYLTIELDANNTEELEAINQQKILYIDNDLNDGTITLLQGEYNYDSSIGANGGYKVDARLN